MPGRRATLQACSATLSSIAASSASLAKITAGTRMPSRGGSSQHDSERRVKRRMSMAVTVAVLIARCSNVHHALRAVLAGVSALRLPAHRELGERGALHLHRGLVPRGI